MTSLEPKDPSSTVPYRIIWGSDLNDGSSRDTAYLQGEVITGSTWTVTPNNTLVVSSSQIEGITTIKGITYPANTITTVVLAGGNVDEVYTVTNHITTATRTDDRSFLINCSNR